MDFKLFGDILQFLSDKGVVAIPLITLLLLLAIIGVISSKDKIYQWLGKKVSVKVLVHNQDDLKYHSLFVKEPKYRLLVQNSKFGSLVKDRVFRFILTARLRSTIDNTMQLVFMPDMEEMPVKKLQYYMQENSRRIVETYNRDIKQYLEDDYGLNAGGRLYEYIMNTVPGGFNTIYDSQILHIDQVTEFLCRGNSAIFKYNVDRVEIYLYELNSLLYLGIADAENLFRGFNGTLEKIVDDYGKEKNKASVYSRG